jgi:hypothetical protein
LRPPGGNVAARSIRGSNGSNVKAQTSVTQEGYTTGRLYQ